MHYYAKAMRNYFNFSGRATRSEFWYFVLSYFVIGLIATVIGMVIFGADSPQSEILPRLVGLAHIVPGLAVQVRRFHDLDRTGWWAVLNITIIGTIPLLILAALRGTAGSNRFGPVPTHDADHAAGSVHARQPNRQIEPSLGTAQTTPTQPAPTAPYEAVKGERDVIADIERLAKLRDSGGLTEAEFEVMKAQALSPARHP